MGAVLWGELGFEVPDVVEIELKEVASNGGGVYEAKDDISGKFSSSFFELVFEELLDLVAVL